MTKKRKGRRGGRQRKDGGEEVVLATAVCSYDSEKERERRVTVQK